MNWSFLNDPLQEKRAFLVISQPWIRQAFCEAMTERVPFQQHARLPHTDALTITTASSPLPGMRGPGR